MEKRKCLLGNLLLNYLLFFLCIFYAVNGFSSTSKITMNTDDLFLDNIVASPENFEGILSAASCCGNKFNIATSWEPSPSVGVVSYRIYNNGNLIRVIQADDPLIFTAGCKSMSVIALYSVTAVDMTGEESLPVSLTLVK